MYQFFQKLYAYPLYVIVLLTCFVGGEVWSQQTDQDKEGIRPKASTVYLAQVQGGEMDLFADQGEIEEFYVEDTWGNDLDTDRVGNATADLELGFESEDGVFQNSTVAGGIHENCTQEVPKRVKRVSKKCDNPEKNCEVWDPPLSNLCRAQTDRMPDFEVHYDYFGKVDCRSRHRKKDTNMIVIHNGDHAEGNNRNWGECRKTSAHYTINRDGKVYHHIGEERVAWHAGEVNGKSIGIELQILRKYGVSCNMLQGKKLKNLANKNGVSESDLIIELCSPSREQYYSLGRLIVDIQSRHTILSDGIVGHCEVVKPGKHSDPRGFDWKMVGLSNRIKQDFVANNKTGCTWYNIIRDVEEFGDD